MSLPRSSTQPLALRCEKQRAAMPWAAAKFGIELDRAGEAGERRRVGLPRPAVDAGHAAQEVVVGVEALGGLALRALDLGPLQPGRDRADHARRHLVLQIEDVGELAVEPVGPQIAAPVAASMSCPAMRTRSPALRTLPSST